MHIYEYICTGTVYVCDEYIWMYMFIYIYIYENAFIHVGASTITKYVSICIVGALEKDWCNLKICVGWCSIRDGAISLS